MLALGEDGLPWNSIKGYGLVYIFSLPFTILGIACEFSKENKENNIFNLWFVISCIMLLIVETNINRDNIIMFPIIYYSVIGIATSIKFKDYFKYVILIVYTVYYIMFEIAYFKTNWSDYSTFSTGIEEVINYVESERKVEKIYFPYNIKEPYIYVLFYGEINPNEYISTIKKKNVNGIFENIKAFGRYEFYNSIEYVEDYKNIYIIPKSSEITLDETKWKRTDFEKYIVLRYINE